MVAQHGLQHRFRRQTLPDAARHPERQRDRIPPWRSSPVRPAASRTLDNSRGLAARYTAVISPHLVNVLSYGYTRLGTASTGNETVIPTFGFTTLAAPPPAPRSASLPPPTSPTISPGPRAVTPCSSVSISASSITIALSFNNLPNYSFSRNTLLGLGADIDADVLAYLQPTLRRRYRSFLSHQRDQRLRRASADCSITSAPPTTLARPAASFLSASLSPQTSAPRNTKVMRRIASSGSATSPSLTAFATPSSVFPTKRRAFRSSPQRPLSQFFAERNGGQLAGIPSYALPNAYITYALGGPVNNKPGYYPTEYNNFAPRLSLAYAPGRRQHAGKDHGQR